MKTINLRNYYDYIKTDTYIDVSDKIFEVFEKERRAEQAYQSKICYHKAFYSLDVGDGIEYAILFRSCSPEEIYERKLTKQQLHNAIASLPDKQAKRIYAHYFLYMSKAAIAKSEGINEGTVRESIKRGLANMDKILKRFF